VGAIDCVLPKGRILPDPMLKWALAGNQNGSKEWDGGDSYRANQGPDEEIPISISSCKLLIK
jgi:hypothetical protein